MSCGRNRNGHNFTVVLEQIEYSVGGESVGFITGTGSMYGRKHSWRGQFEIGFSQELFSTRNIIEPRDVSLKV